MKQRICLLLVTALFITVVAFPAQAEMQSSADLSSPVSADLEDIYDVPCYAPFISMMRSGKMLEKPELMVGDINFTGTVDSADALLALKYSISANNPCSGVWWGPRFGWAKNHNWGTVLEEGYIAYYSSNYDRSQVMLGDVRFWHYFLNSALMSDVNMDMSTTASDALMILQYAVGKRTSFVRQGTEGFRCGTPYSYVMWPDEWTPGAYNHFDNEEYDAMDASVYAFDSPYPPNLDEISTRSLYLQRMLELELYPQTFVAFLITNRYDFSYYDRDLYLDWLKQNGYQNQ